MSRNDIDDTVRDMWSTRPHRRKNDRKIAGVAAAIGRRYGIDPILVRIAFVVATIYGGVGILLYLLGWLLLPEEGDEVSAAEALFGQGHSSMSKPLTVVLMLALIPAASGAFWGDVSALFTLLLVGAALYLLHRSRGDTAMAVEQPKTVADESSAPTDTPGERKPPAWDPLGVAPFAWDLPEPSPTPAAPAPPRRRSVITPVTIGLALMLVAGVGSILALTGDWIGAQQVAALTLAVIGGGLVVGAFRRGGRGLIALAIPLALVTYALSVTSIDTRDGFGERRWQASTVADVQPQYKLAAGATTLDMRQLRLTDAERVQTDIKQGAGRVTVLLPQNADVEVHCKAGAGDLDCLGGRSDGIGPREDRVDLGPDGEGGGKIVMDVSMGAGKVEVHRG